MIRNEKKDEERTDTEIGKAANGNTRGKLNALNWYKVSRRNDIIITFSYVLEIQSPFQLHAGMKAQELLCDI